MAHHHHHHHRSSSYLLFCLPAFQVSNSALFLPKWYCTLLFHSRLDTILINYMNAKAHEAVPWQDNGDARFLSANELLCKPCLRQPSTSNSYPVWINSWYTLLFGNCCLKWLNRNRCIHTLLLKSTLISNLLVYTKYKINLFCFIMKLSIYHTIKYSTKMLTRTTDSWNR